MSENKTMDRSEVKTTAAKPVSLDPNMPKEELMKLLSYRSQLMGEVADKYLEFVKAIKRLPIHLVYAQHANLFLDTAQMWAEKGIMNVNELPSEEECEPETPKNETETAETEVADLEAKSKDNQEGDNKKLADAPIGAANCH